MLCPFPGCFAYVERGDQVQKVRRTTYGFAVSIIALFAAAMTTGMSPYKSVQVTVDSRTIQAGTYASESVGAFLRQNGVAYTGYDLVEPARTTPVQNGMKIVVKRAKTVRLANGPSRPVTVHTLAGTVKTLLQSLRIRLHQGDSVNVSLHAAIRSGMDIQVIRRSTRVMTNEVPIPYETIRQASPDYQAGVDVVARAGQSGERRIVTRLTFVNDRLVAKRSTSTVVQQPVDELIDVGTAQPAPVVASRSDASLVSNEVLTVVATAYSNPGGTTATGASAGYGDVAVDPSIIPLGTRLYIPGYGYGIANDTGGAIQGYRIDLCFNSTAQAYAFGRQVVKVYILGRN